MTINEFRNRIRINKYVFSQTANGSNQKTLDSSYDLWAKVKQLTESRILDNMGLTYSKAMEITTRYEVSRPLSLTDEIGYEGQQFVIGSLNVVDDGKAKNNVITVYTTGQSSDETTPPLSIFYWEEAEW